jgi:hypothetical protein
MQQTLPTSTIQLRADDLDFLYTLVSDPGLLTRNVSGFGKNLTPGRIYWGSSDQPFLRLAPAHNEPLTSPDEPQRGPRHLGRRRVDAPQPTPRQRSNRPTTARC